MFRTVPLSIIRSFFCTHSNGICHTGLQDQDETSWSCSQTVSKPVWHTLVPLLCVQWRTDDGQRNCPKHVEFYSKNKFDKLVHLVGFIIKIYLTMHYTTYWLYEVFWISFCVQVFTPHIIKYFTSIYLGHCVHVQWVGVHTLVRWCSPPRWP